jgi:uncharacterized membrane protein HdeD (DUF308 family)
VIDQLVQAWILVFSGAAALMVARTDRWHRWGHVAGLISQPAYIYTTFVHGQWAMLLLTAFYSWCWLQGIRRRFN